MKIEIHNGASSAESHPLTKDSTSVGASTTSDIKVVAEGVSRKHIVILRENDDYFVIDQGSTNGTYINEEQLVAGKKYPFTTFFPLKLGVNVLVSLVNSDDAVGRPSRPMKKDNEGTVTTTTVFPRKELAPNAPASAQSQSVNAKKGEAPKKNSAKSPGKTEEPSKAKTYGIILVAVLVGAAVYYTQFMEQ